MVFLNNFDLSEFINNKFKDAYIKYKLENSKDLQKDIIEAIGIPPTTFKRANGTVTWYFNYSYIYSSNGTKLLESRVIPNSSPDGKSIYGKILEQYDYDANEMEVKMTQTVYDLEDVMQRKYTLETEYDDNMDISKRTFIYYNSQGEITRVDVL